MQAAPTMTLTDAELRDVVAETVAARAALEAGYLHVLAALDARGQEAVPGASTGTAGATFLIHATHASPAQASRDVRAARALDVDGSGIVQATIRQTAPTRPIRRGGKARPRKSNPRAERPGSGSCTPPPPPSDDSADAFATTSCASTYPETTHPTPIPDGATRHEPLGCTVSTPLESDFFRGHCAG